MKKKRFYIYISMALFEPWKLKNITASRVKIEDFRRLMLARYNIASLLHKA